VRRDVSTATVETSPSTTTIESFLSTARTSIERNLGGVRNLEVGPEVDADDKKGNGQYSFAAGVANEAYSHDDIELASMGSGCEQQQQQQLPQQQQPPWEEEKQERPALRGRARFLGRRIAILDRFMTPGWLLASLCLAGIVQGMIFTNVVISSLERRFGLHSTQSGLIAGNESY